MAGIAEKGGIVCDLELSKGDKFPHGHLAARRGARPSLR